MDMINRAIEVVAVFNKDGSIRPERFRIETEDGSETVMKIARIRHMNEERLQDRTIIRRYLCTIEINGVQRQCEIGYNTNSLKWTLLKI